LAVLFGRIVKGAIRPTPACTMHPSRNLSKPADRDDCMATLLGYARSFGPGTGRVERYWQISAA